MVLLWRGFIELMNEHTTGTTANLNKQGITGGQLRLTGWKGRFKDWPQVGKIQGSQGS